MSCNWLYHESFDICKLKLWLVDKKNNLQCTGVHDFFGINRTAKTVFCMSKSVPTENLHESRN